jgi:hypothetical protein
MDETGQTKAEVINTRMLGWYLTLCAIYQVCIYFFLYSSGPLPKPESVFGDRYRHSTWFDFGNPRELFGEDLLYWILAAWIFAIGLAMVAKPRNKYILQAYLIVELPLVVLESLGFLFSMAFRASDLDLQSTALVATFFSVLPCVYGLWMMRKTRPTFLKWTRTENWELRTGNYQ